MVFVIRCVMVFVLRCVIVFELRGDGVCDKVCDGVVIRCVIVFELRYVMGPMYFEELKDWIRRVAERYCILLYTVAYYCILCWIL